MRQTTASAPASSGATSRTSRQKARLSSVPSSSIAAPDAASSSRRPFRRASTDGATPSMRSAVRSPTWAAPETSCGLPIAAHIAGHGSGVVEAVQQQRARLVGRGQDLHRDLVEHGERAPRAGEQLGEIVAGDVLHHPAARLEGLAAAVDAAEAQQVIARRTGREAARAGEVAHHRADQRALARLAAEQRAEIGRLEGQHLVALREQRLDLAA